MLMLTHTYLLQKVLGAANPKSEDLDIYIYNIAPDLLTIHPDINSDKTHNIKRFLKTPAQYPKLTYVMFHLLVDDFAHHGYISLKQKEEFNPDSQGYCYIKGKPLIADILDMHNKIQNEISYNEAAYRSHLIIEMIYDLVILNQINSFKTISLLADAINYTVKNKLDEFASTISWLYEIKQNDIKDLMKEVCIYLTEERMERIMNIEGRVRLYSDKFGIRNKDELFNDCIRNLFLLAKNSLELDERELFLRQTAQNIIDYGWLPPIK